MTIWVVQSAQIKEGTASAKPLLTEAKDSPAWE